ncbi:MAG: PAS domain S-box protein [Acidimicrobiia bacterium]
MHQGHSPATPQQWQAFAAALHVPMLVCSPVRRDGQLVDIIVVDANAAALSQMHTTLDDLRGLTLHEASPVTDVAVIEQVLGRLSSGHVALHFANRSTTPDGVARSFDVVVVSFDGLVGVAWFEVTNFELALDEVREARDELAEEERRYRLLAENASDLVYEIDLDERCVWISPSVEAILGWEPADILGTHMLELVHPDDRQLVRQHRGDALDRESAEQIQFRVRHADGSHRWMLGRARPHRDDDGAVVGGYIHLTDIEDLVAARDAFAASEARYRLLAEGALDVVWQTDRDGFIRWVSPSIERELGYPPEEIVGRNTAELLYPDDLAVILELRRRLYEEGRIVEGFEVRFVRRDGSVCWMSARARPLNDIDGKVVAAIVALRDIEAAHHGREALAASERRFRLLAEHASDVVYELDGDGLIHWVSPSVERELGYTPAELIGRASLEIIHPDDHSLVHATRTARAAGLPPDRIEIRYLTPEGASRWMSVRADAVEGDDGRATFVIALRDIDDEHRARDELAESEARLRMLAENVSDVIVEFDRDTVAHWISPSVQWIFGWHPTELLGNSLVALAHPSEHVELMEAWQRLLDTGRPQEMQLRVRTSDGNYRWMIGRTRPASTLPGR